MATAVVIVIEQIWFVQQYIQNFLVKKEPRSICGVQVFLTKLFNTACNKYFELQHTAVYSDNLSGYIRAHV
jgi:hypothetical protein